MSKPVKPVSVVVSTREIDLNYEKHIRKVFSHPKTQVLIYENKGDESLASLYNRSLNDVVNSIVVFMHDDLIIETTNVTKKLNDLFNKNSDFGIIGVAGTTKLSSGCWWEDRNAIQGQVKHQKDNKIWRNDYSGTFGDSLKEVVVVDGLFIAIEKERLSHFFDEDFKGFHFYDLPICLKNTLEGVKVGVTTKLKIIHKSLGPTSLAWEKNKYFFEAKYGEFLPIVR